MIRVSLAFVAVLTVACGDNDGGIGVVDADLSDVGPDAPPREVIMETRALMPGEFAEGIMTSGPGDAAHIVLHGQFPAVSYNIHGHAGGGTQIVHEDFDQMDVVYLFKPTSQARWYLLVRNDGSVAMEVDIQVGIYGDMTWEWE